MNSDLGLAHRLADIADSLSLPGFGDPAMKVERKPDQSPVTETDRAIERAIREEIAAVAAGDSILGEEFGSSGSGDRCWFIDPIDGTKSYIRGNENWATLIALRVDGDVQVAIASLPALGQRYHATRGGGSWLGDERLNVSKIDTVEDALLAHSSLSGFMQTDLSDRLEELAKRCWDARGMGNSLSHLSVARGSADIGWTSRAYPWDFAALSLIVEEAGGSFWDGTRHSVDGAMAPGVSSNGLLREMALAAAGIS